MKVFPYTKIITSVLKTIMTMTAHDQLYKRIELIISSSTLRRVKAKHDNPSSIVNMIRVNKTSTSIISKNPIGLSGVSLMKTKVLINIPPGSDRSRNESKKYSPRLITTNKKPIQRK